MLYPICYMIYVINYVLYVIWYMLYFICYMVCVRCCMVYVICYMLYVYCVMFYMFLCYSALCYVCVMCDMWYDDDADEDDDVEEHVDDCRTACWWLGKAQQWLSLFGCKVAKKSISKIWYWSRIRFCRVGNISPLDFFAALPKATWLAVHTTSIVGVRGSPERRIFSRVREGEGVRHWDFPSRVFLFLFYSPPTLPPEKK